LTYAKTFAQRKSINDYHFYIKVQNFTSSDTTIFFSTLGGGAISRFMDNFYHTNFYEYFIFL